MKENLNIDELLNGYIDGQLSARNQTEVKRLIHHDPTIGNRLMELQRCKMLVSSLPSAEAPEGIAEDVKATLERRTLLGHQSELSVEIRGARYLVARKVLAAAAMIGLVSVLAVVVYSIIAPEPSTEKTAAIQAWMAVEKPEAADISLSVAKLTTAGSAVPFNGTVVLKAANLNAARAVIKRAIDDNVPSEQFTPSVLSNAAGPYVLNCSTETLASLLADLQNVWQNFDSATLIVGIAGNEVAVDNVTPQQINQLARYESLEKRMRMAKDISALNDMDRLMPGTKVFAIIDKARPDLITPPKPVLTSNEKKIKKPAAKVSDEQKINLTIVVTGNK